MTANQQLSGLIHPFNLMDPNNRAEMFKSKPPLGTTMVMYLVGDTNFPYDDLVSGRNPKTLAHWEDCDVTDLAYVLGPVAKECIKNSRLPGIRFESIAADECEEIFPFLEWVPLNQSQCRWAVDGKIKLQVAYYDIGQIQIPPHAISAIYAAMTVYDRIYSVTGITDPKDQPTLSVDTTLERTFRVFVDCVYKERIGVWCRDLVNLRNEVMVNIRAVLHGQDPEVEWKTFCDAGMVHFLDYLNIWQPPQD